MNLINLIYPKRCLFCDELLNIDHQGTICDKCIHKPIYIYGKLHGKAINMVEEVYCLYLYEKPVSDAILSLKFGNRPDKGVGFGILLAECIRINLPNLENVVPVAVPLGQKRKRERRYNQSDIIAARVARSLNIPYTRKIVARIKETDAQSTLGKNDRIINVSGCFKVDKPGCVLGKTVIIIDDVITTGSTLNELAGVLLNAGAKKIIGAVVATSETG